MKKRSAAKSAESSGATEPNGMRGGARGGSMLLWSRARRDPR
ncbi:MAG: hypothetical protein UX17_C0048G0009 [Parcubacteria group bacterium GW2011_GWC2_45_7]|nr:MAG: hypothetical protein UX17_C0048G0009 [Parcubacteria group bacterium GW2011_GWC2_45_7]KKU71914.1 MAG: hypothetical protein UX98_C0021G0008 [Parcubacteria group bacterium GW2011_GWA2_47_26]